MVQILIEGVIVGIVIVILGYFIVYDLNKYIMDYLNIKNKKFIKLMNLFMSGFLTHILFELGGFNKWYCKNGNACK